MNLIVSRISEKTLKLNDGKEVDIMASLDTITTESGSVTVRPKSKVAIRKANGLTNAQAAFVHRQVSLRVKQAESAAFGALCSQDNTVGLGVKQLKSGAVWFGVKEVTPIAAPAVPKATSAEAAEAKALREQNAAIMEALKRAGVDITTLLAPAPEPAPAPETPAA